MLQWIRMRDYFSRSSHFRRYAVPTLTGVYLWTLDISAPPHQDLDSLLVSAPRTWGGRVPPYYDVYVKPSPEPWSSTSRTAFQHIQSHDPDAIQWLFRQLMVLQRPLYIGKAFNIATRFDQHLSPGSPFRERLHTYQIDLTACAFCWIPLPERYQAPTLPDPDSGSPEPDSLPPSESLAADNASQPYSPSPTRLLQLTEAAFIRFLQPDFNERQE